MNILMVLSSHGYPPDRRVEREARDLIRDGHTVFLMARRCAGQAAAEEVDGVHVLRVPLLFQRAGPIGGLWYYFVHRYFILFRILSACRRHRIDALHVHDLPYAFATVLAGKILGIPVVFDMHDHYTFILKISYESGAYRWLKPFGFLQLTPLRIEERIACRWATSVIVVGVEHISRITQLGASREKVFVVANTEDAVVFGGYSIDESVLEKYRDDFILLYVGIFTPSRGMETAIQSLPLILEKIPNARLLLVGDGYAKADWQRLIGELGLTAHVTFAGYQRFELLPTYIECSDVCLIPHVSNANIETGAPNKLFQFMIMGKPIVASDTRPTMRVVNDAQCGVIFEDRNAESLAAAVIQLQDDGLRRRLGENGRRAVEDRYNWQQTVQPLLEFYRSVSA
ncbi:MAG: glycosyltransferase family 4 protein [Phycisphaerae bacterium]